MNVVSVAKLNLENDLRIAIRKNQLLLYYQPIVDMEENVIGAEALVRWLHPKLGLLSPNEFVPIAEESGLIIELGDWVLRTASLCHARCVKRGLMNERISINISSRQFLEVDLLERVNEIQRETGIDPQYLEFEITEGVAMDSSMQTAGRIKSLRDMGIALSIDDFGTGYSFFGYLKRFPVRRLKIDRSFIAHCTTDEYDASIVQTIISMAHGLDIKVIAEGVESYEQFKFLREAGSDGVQGYLISRPLSEEMFVEYLERKKQG
jgi:EAL domain-containing protein (putative c-di-GMP-specific phosphodiesterase class I)